MNDVARKKKQKETKCFVKNSISWYSYRITFFRQQKHYKRKSALPKGLYTSLVAPQGGNGQ